MDDLELRMRRMSRYAQLIPEHVRQGLLLVFGAVLLMTVFVGILIELT